MPKVIIVEPDITEEENQKNWQRVEEILNSIAQDLKITQDEDVELKDCCNL